MLDDTRRISLDHDVRRDISHDDGAGADDGIPADPDSRQDDRIHKDPDIVLNHGFLALLVRPETRMAEYVASSGDVDIAADRYAASSLVDIGMEADKTTLSDLRAHGTIVVQAQPGNESGQSVPDFPEDQLSSPLAMSGRFAALLQSTFSSRGRTKLSRA